MNIFGLIGAYFTIFAAGFGITLLVMRAETLNFIECAALSWLIGTGVVSLLLWLGGMVCSGLILQSIVTLVCLALAFLGWRTIKQRLVRFSMPRLIGSVEWILAVLLALELIAILFISLKHTLGWDGLFNWEIKARYAFLNSGTLPQSYYSSPGRGFSHPEYPLAIPFAELWLYLWMGAPHQFWIKTIFPLFYISGALLLSLFVARLTGKRWLGLLIAVLMPFVPFITASPGGVTVGYADVPLAVFYLVALGYLVCSLESNSTEAFVVYAAILTFVPWIKSEGMILWSLLALLGLIAGFIRHRIRFSVLAIVPGLVLILAWRGYLKAIHAVMPADFARPSFELLGQNIGRVGGILRTALAEVTEISHWSIFWLLALIAFGYLLFARQLSRLIVAAGLIGPVVLYLFTYVFSAWPSYTAHITSSLPRLFLQVLPTAWLAIALALAPAKTRANEYKIG